MLMKNPGKFKKVHVKLYPYIGYHSLKYKVNSILQRFELDFPIKYAVQPNSILPFTENNPMFIHFFDFIAWNSIENIKILKNELQWNRSFNLSGCDE